MMLLVPFLTPVWGPMQYFSATTTWAQKTEVVSLCRPIAKAITFPRRGRTWGEVPSLPSLQEQAAKMTEAKMATEIKAVKESH